MKNLLIALMLVISTSVFSQVTFDLKYYDLGGKSDWKDITGTIMWGGLNIVIDDNEEEQLIAVKLNGNSFRLRSSNSNNQVVYTWDAKLDLIGKSAQYDVTVLMRLDADSDLYITIYSEKDGIFLSYFAEQQTDTRG